MNEAMTHEDAIAGHAVERYMLGELAGEARDRFEDHLFGCVPCAAELKSGVLLVEAAREVMAAPEPVAFPIHAAPVAASRRAPLAWPNRSWAWPAALAACLAVIVYQSGVTVPRLRGQLAQSQVARVEAPAVMTPLVLANPGARGVESVPALVTQRGRGYLLQVDLPPASGAAFYRCSLYSPAGVALWHVDVSPAQARDAVTIEVPASTGQEGVNELRVESGAGGGNGDTLVLLARYRYRLSFAP